MLWVFLNMFAASRLEPKVNCANTSPTATTVTPTHATAYLIIKRNGVIQATGNSDADWVFPKYSVVGDGFDCKLEYVSGTDLIGGLALATWYNVNSDRSWSYTTVGAGVATGTYTLTFRNASTLAEVDTASITFICEEAVA